jgi:glutaredoxin
MLIAVALGSAGMLAWPVISSGARPGRSLTANGAVQLINREKAVVVDVCEDVRIRGGPCGGRPPCAAGRAGGRSCPAVKNKALPVILVCAVRGPVEPGRGHCEEAGLRAGPFAVRRDAGLERRQPAGRESLNPGTAMQTVKMYTTAVCPYCIRAKQLLSSRRGVPQIEEIRVDLDADRARSTMMANHRSAHRAADLHRRSTHVGGHATIWSRWTAARRLLPLLEGA